MNLHEWTVHYIKARDSMERKLKNLEDHKDRIVCTYKDKTVTFVAQESLGVAPEGNTTIVTTQNQRNFDTLLHHFDTYAKNANLTIIFLNPRLNEKWLIKPAVHAAVADKSSLKAGLLSLYQTVPPV